MAEIATPSPFGCATVHSRHVTHIDITDLWVHHPQWQSSATTTTTAATSTSTASSGDNNINNNRNSSTHRKNNNNNWLKAREMVLSIDHGPAKGPHHVRKQSFEVSDSGGVSSLVQKWKGFEATESPNKSPNNNNNNNKSNIITSSSQDIVYVAAEPPPTPTPTLNEDYDWESDHNDRTGPPSSCSRDSDSVADMERLRVADIIRKWKDHTNNVGCCDSPPRVFQTAASSPERRCSPSGVVLNSPRIRGRQAFHDLLMQIERDRTKELECLVERKPVSKFSHRGRIQSLLRFRFLNRGVESKEVYHSNEKPPRSVPKTRESVILPERMDDTCTTQNRCSENRTDTTTIQGSEVPVTPRQHDVGQKVSEDTENNGRLFHRYENLGHEKNPFSTLLTRRENVNNHSRLAEIIITESPCTSSVICNKEENYDDHTVMKTNNYDPTSDYEEPSTSYHEDEATRSSSQHDLVDDDTGMYWGRDTEADVWEELESDNQEQEQERTNREWIDEVSRPRSDWEDLRQARYQEMLDPFSENEEIRVLLGRKSVSSFLSSGLRDKIDQMMASRVQGPQTPTKIINRAAREEKHEARLSEQVADVVISSDKQKITEEEGEEEVFTDVNFDVYGEAESSMGGPQQYNNESDDYVYTDQITESPQESSWPQNQLGSDYSYMDASPTTQHSSSDYYSQNSRPHSSNSARPVVDMELIYDLRGHMQQLHQEMSELRKSIKCCVDMQIELQRSVKKEVTIALRHSEAKNRRRNNGMKKVTSVGGKCCVCCKMQVDSLLYRCGHMCTCFKCAHKLLWSSGKCPICRSPILDVVRTYSNHSSPMNMNG